SKQRDPIQGEFFNTESISTTADAVVRESGQNTLDAAEYEPARVRMRIYVSGEGGAVPAAEAEPYFDGLWDHVEAVDAEVAALADNPCPFLVVEDFGTTGLLGDE